MVDDKATARIEEVLARAATDGRFRKGLLEEPRKTLQTMSDYVLPETLRIKFIEKGIDCDALFVLPDPVTVGELSLEELEAVAGGVGVSGPTTIYDPTGGYNWSGE